MTIRVIYSQKNFWRRRIARTPFLSTSFRENGENGRMKDEKVAGSRNPERQPIRKQFSAHLGRSGESSTLLGRKGRRERNAGGSERSHKAAREKPHPRTRINIPRQTWQIDQICISPGALVGVNFDGLSLLFRRPPPSSFSTLQLSSGRISSVTVLQRRSLTLLVLYFRV